MNFICIDCGYDLNQLGPGTLQCPECGFFIKQSEVEWQKAIEIRRATFSLAPAMIAIGVTCLLYILWNQFFIRNYSQSSSENMLVLSSIMFIFSQICLLKKIKYSTDNFSDFSRGFFRWLRISALCAYIFMSACLAGIGATFARFSILAASESYFPYDEKRIFLAILTSGMIVRIILLTGVSCLSIPGIACALAMIECRDPSIKLFGRTFLGSGALFMSVCFFSMAVHLFSDMELGKILRYLFSLSIDVGKLKIYILCFSLGSYFYWALMFVASGLIVLIGKRKWCSGRLDSSEYTS